MIDWTNPVNIDAPLNRGLLDWWIVGQDNPYWGGATWFDLCRDKHGTLTSGPVWKGNVGPYENWGALEFSNSPYVNLGTSDFISSSSPFTVSWWEYVGSTPTTFPAVARFTSGSYQFIILRNSHANYSNLVVGKADISNGVRFTSVPSLASGVGNWNHWCVMGSAGMGDNTPSNFTAYVNSTSYSATSSNSLSVSGTNSYLGWDGADDKWKGMLDDFRLYNRVLSALEVYQLYRAGIEGYPIELNRRRLMLYDDTVPPVGGQARRSIHQYRMRRVA